MFQEVYNQLTNERLNERQTELFRVCRLLNENMADFAKKELELSGLFNEDSDYGGMLGNAVMELMNTFSGQGHSGYSAEMTIDLFTRLAKYENLTPLTEDPDEWMDVTEYALDQQEGKMFQSRRNSECFSHDGGKTYYKLSDGSNQVEQKKMYTSEPVKRY